MTKAELVEKLSKDAGISKSQAEATVKDPAAETAGRQRQKENSQFSWQAFRLNDVTYIGACGKDRRVYHL